MLLTEDEMESPILLAALVMEVRIEAAQPGPWLPAPPRFQTCTTDLKFRVLQVLKGDAGDAGAAGATPERVVDVQITQARPAGSRYIALPGVWSGHELLPGARFVTFSATAGADLAAALSDPACLAVEPSEVALADARRALVPLPDTASIGALLQVHAPSRRDFGALFAGYVVDRVIETFFDDRDGFEQVLVTAGDAQLPPQVALILLRGIGDALLRHEPAPDRYVAGYVMTAALVAARPDNAALRAILLQNYLPGLLGLTGGVALRSAAAVFAADPPARDALRDLLAQCPQVAAALLSWVNG